MFKCFVKASTLITILITGCFSSNSFQKAETAYYNEEYEKAFSLYEKACNEGNFKACIKLASSYENGNHLKQNQEKADTFYTLTFQNAKTACEKSDIDACHIISSLYEQGKGTDVNIEESNKILDKLCNLGQGSSCYELAKRNGQNIQDYILYMEKACQLNNLDSCVDLANMYINGFNEYITDIDKNRDKGLALLEKACNESIIYCEYLGDMYISGEYDFITQDYNKSNKYFKDTADYYDKLCKEGDDIACIIQSNTIKKIILVDE